MLGRAWRAHCDDEAQALFVGEEARGVWRFDAEPSVTAGPGYEGVLIANTDPVRALGARRGGRGDRQNLGLRRLHLRFESGRQHHGAFVTQDDSNDGLNQNFKLVPLEQILGGVPVVDDSACGSGSGGSGAGGGGSGGGGSGGAGGSGPAGYGEPFCTTFCDKCAACYATGTFSEGDCVYQQPKTAFTVPDCKAEPRTRENSEPAGGLTGAKLNARAGCRKLR